MLANRNLAHGNGGHSVDPSLRACRSYTIGFPPLRLESPNLKKDKLLLTMRRTKFPPRRGAPFNFDHGESERVKSAERLRSLLLTTIHAAGAI